MKKRVIVCAAIEQDGVVYCGPRHHHILRHMRDIGVPKGEHTQGFVDNFNKFLTREKALDVATQAIQIQDKSFPLDQLFSEDLY